MPEVTEAFTTACSFGHEAIASLLRDRVIAFDPVLGPRVDRSLGRPAFAKTSSTTASQAIEFAFTYANTHVIPVLTRIWPLPDDLPHAAGSGDLSRVKQWFDDSGAPALGKVQTLLDAHRRESAARPVNERHRPPV